MAYHLCKKDHYVSGKEGGQCPVATCQSKIGPPIARTDPDPRGDDPFGLGLPAADRQPSPAACKHFLCDEWFPNIKAFLGHFPTCPALDRGEQQVYRSAAQRQI